MLAEFGINIFRNVGAFLDGVVLKLIGKAYDLIYACATAEFFTNDMIKHIMNNVYVIIGLFALFKVALLLVNSIINPDKLTEKGNGIGNVLINILIMFVFLVATPILFQEAFSLQKKVVEGNYIQKIFIDVDELNNQPKTPGEELEDIVISTLIPINEEAVNCGSKGDAAKAAYEDMKVNGFKMSTIAKYANIQCDTDPKDGSESEEVYVYDYNWPITLIVAGFIVYILLSFAIDIAVRSAELAALQLLAPMFIVTYIDPKSAKSGPFNKWLTTVGKTYVSLFIKIAIVSVMLLLISLVDEVKLSTTAGGFGKILLLIGILIFAKKAPKWIGDMIGVEGGVSELGIGKKLAGAALVGGALQKGLSGAGKGLAGAGIGAARHAYALRKGNKKLQKDSGERAFDRAKKSAKMETGFGNKAKAYMGTYFKRDDAKQNVQNWANTAKAGFKGLYSGAIAGASLGLNAKDIKDVNAQLKGQQKDMQKGAGYISPVEKVGTRIKKSGESAIESVIGSQSAQDIRKKNIENKELAEKMLNKKLYMNADGDLFYDEDHKQLAAFDAKTMRKKYGKTINGIEDVVASMVSGTPNSNFVTKAIGSQTYIDSSGATVTTGRIETGTLVRDKVDATGKTIYDINGNAVKEAVINSSTGSSYNITDAEIKDIIDEYTAAAKDKTGKTGINASINGQTLELTGQGILEYEAAFASIKDENANTWVSVNERKGNITQQLAELQSSFAAAQSNLSTIILETEYGRAEKRKTETTLQLDSVVNLMSEYVSKSNAIKQDIVSAQTQLSNATNPDIISKLNKFIEKRTEELEKFKLEQQKLNSQKGALENIISNCDSIMADPAVLSTYNSVVSDSNEKISAITDKISELQAQKKELTKELGLSISYGSDIITKVAGVEEVLNSSNSERFLAEISRQKKKTRENADNFKNEKKDKK